MNGSNAVASMMKENTRIVQEQIEFSNKYEALTKQYEEQKNSLDKVAKEKVYKTGKTTKMRAYLEAMKQADDYIEEWSEEAWILMVERATVNRDKTITFKFVNSKDIQFYGLALDQLKERAHSATETITLTSYFVGGFLLFAVRKIH